MYIVCPGWNYTKVLSFIKHLVLGHSHHKQLVLFYFILFFAALQIFFCTGIFVDRNNACGVLVYETSPDCKLP